MENYALKQMTKEHVHQWMQLPSIGVDGMMMEDQAYGGDGHEIVQHLSLARLVLGVPERWALRHFIVDVEKNSIIGTMGFRNGPAFGKLEVGYSVAPSYQGKGVATWALNELIKQSLVSDPKIPFFARTLQENIASQRVLLKAGFVYKGLVMSELGIDLCLFELTPNQ